MYQVWAKSIEGCCQGHQVKVLDKGICHALRCPSYPLANEVARGYSNATVRPSVRPSQSL
jgi:hypothetical protein